MFVYLRLGIILSGFLCLSGTLLADGSHSRIAPPQDEKQLPFAMHSSMAQLPVIRIRIRGETDGLIFEGNEIRDTRERSQQTQKVGVLIDQPVRSVELRSSKIAAQHAVQDNRQDKPVTSNKP